MKLKCLSVILLSLSLIGLISCETVDQGPQPERERLSSIPHNMPASWEGQAGFPGGMGGQQAGY